MKCKVVGLYFAFIEKSENSKGRHDAPHQTARRQTEFARRRAPLNPKSNRSVSSVVMRNTRPWKAYLGLRESLSQTTNRLQPKVDAGVAYLDAGAPS